MKKTNAKSRLGALVCTVFLFCLGSMVWAQGLLYKSDFTYVGSFKMPGGDYGSCSFGYSNGGVAGTVYNDPVYGKSIFATGFLSTGYVSRTPSVAQVTIPVLRDINTVGIDGLRSAVVVQGFADPSNGAGEEALPSAGCIGIVCYGGKLIGTENAAYDGGCEQTKSAWVAPLDFSQSSQATGPYAFNAPVGPRYVGGGYMTLVPPEWQTVFGGKVVSGNGPWSCIFCGTPGPALHVIDADMLISQPAESTPIPATSLVYYEDGVHSSLGSWNSNDPDQIIDGKNVPDVTVTDPHGRGTFTIPYEDNSMRVQGVLFADSTRSVLFFGSKGLGPYCYGEGSDCGDPDRNSKGDHAYPYTEFVWAYDVNDLIAAKNGQKHPWEILPYTGWIPDLPLDDPHGSAIGVAWDPETRLAYLAVDCAWGDCYPLVHVFSVNSKTSSVETAGKNVTRISMTAAPNPFNPAINISVNMSTVSLRIFDAAGRFVEDLSKGVVRGRVTWDASLQSSGVYIVSAQCKNAVVIKAITLIK